MQYPSSPDNLDNWFPASVRPDADSRLGLVVGGSLSKGLVCGHWEQSYKEKDRMMISVTSEIQG